MIDRLIDLGLGSDGRSAVVAWTLIWQSTVWLIIGLVATRFWRRRAGRAHLLLTLATCAAVVSPLLTLVVQRMEWGVLPPPPVIVEAAPEPVAATPIASPPSSVREPFDPPIDRNMDEVAAANRVSTAPTEVDPPVANLDPPKNDAKAEPAPVASVTRLGDFVPKATGGLWVAVSFVLTIRLILSLLAGGRIARKAREEHSSGLLAALREAAAALSLKSVPQLCVSSFARCPMIWCWGRRPVVLLPESATEQSPVLWRSVFCHELAHLVRRDHWSALWAEIVVILLPWQPLAWQCRRHLAFLREQACDDWVLAAGGAATDYAESLLQFVPQGSPVHALAAVSSRESLKRRLEHVLSGMRSAPNVGRRWIVVASLGALTAIAGVGFAQQGRRVASADPASNPEIAKETPATPPNASQPAASQNPTPAVSQGVVVLRGRVNLPNGHPAVGATVRAIKSVFRPHSLGQPPESKTVLATFTADSQGEFAGNVEAGRLREGDITLDLWATLPGYGLALHPIESTENLAPISMSLADEEPIRGRIIDLEGRPVRDARVEVVQYFDTTTASIDQWLTTVQSKDAEYRSALLPDKPSAWMPGAVITPLKTNSEGRFEVKGIGRDRRLSLRISGPRLALTGAIVIARRIKPIGKFSQILGSEFDRAVSPGIALEGFVTDEESGKPIPGVQLDASAAGYAPTTTDSRGHYRFDSLTPGSRLTVDLRARELPYFSGVQGFPIPAGVSLEPIRKDFKLRRGVWAVGRAYDRVTGKPVSGTVYYNPYLSNEVARHLASNDPAFWQGLHDCGRADEEGHIRAVVIPGRGVISLQCETGDYRFNFGLAQIKEITEAVKARRASPLYTIFWSEMYQSVREINVPPGARETTIDLPVDPGQNVVLKFADAAGNRLAGVETYGLRFADALRGPGRDKSFAAGDSAILYATYPEEKRTIWFRHRSSGLAALLQFTAKAGETERAIILEPPAVATGRLVASEGKPLSGIEVHCDVGGDTNNSFPPVLTDAEGRFRRDLPPGGPLTVSCSGVRLPDLTVVSREQIDLGEIRIERNAKQPWMSKAHRGPMKRTKPLAAATAPTVSAPTSEVRSVPTEGGKKGDTHTNIREVRGRVLLPNGQPAVGAIVSATNSLARPDGRGEVKVLATFHAGANGQFEGSVELGPMSDRRDKANLWATLPGYGLALHPLTLAEKTEAIVMNLVTEEAIRGRLIDLEGRPVPQARLEIISYTDTTTEWVDQWLASLSETTVSSRIARIEQPIDEARSSRTEAVLRVKSRVSFSNAVVAPVTTNADGRFEFRGLGRDRLIGLVISGSHLVTTDAGLLTRPIKPLHLRHQEVRGSQFDRVVSPSVPVAGFVTDEETGKPISGARILPTATLRRDGRALGDPSLAVLVSGTTDGNGHFLLYGLDTSYVSLCEVSVPDSPYPCAFDVELPASKNLLPIRRDIKLRRGAWAVGRAYDHTTGAPVAGALYYTPFRSNQFAQKYQLGIHADYRTFPVGFTDAHGGFRIPVMPGRGMIQLRCTTGDYCFNFGKEKIKELSDPKSEVVAVPWMGGFHSVCGIDVAPDGESKIDLPVDPGQNVTLRFVDVAGKGLAGIETYGLRFDRISVPGQGRSYTPGDSATIYAIAPNERRTLWLKQRSSGLSRLLQFTQKPQQVEQTIVLEPSAVVTGHVISPDGTPLSELKVECAFTGSTLSLPAVMTDADGRFREELPAGGPFYLSVSGANAQLAQDLKVSAGERVDFGDITIERDPKRPRMSKVHRGPEKRTKPAAQVSHHALTLSGQVLSENGTPIPGARVSATATNRANEPGGSLKDRHEILGETTTDAAGMFRINLAGVSTKSHRYPVLMAASDGYGLASQSFNLDGNNPNSTLHLQKEQVVRGRFVDLQGQPAAGVSARVARITLAPMTFLPPDSPSLGRALQAASAWPKSITSDEQGRFAIRGVAPHQIIHLGVNGNDRYATQFVPLNRRRREGDSTFVVLKPGEEAIVPLSPATIIEGVIRFADTKQPAPKTRFTVYARQEKSPFGSYVGLSGQADEHGRFRIVPFPGLSFKVTAYPPQGTPYLIRENVAEVEAAKSALEINVDMPRGVLVRGKIVDTDGQPIANASLQYLPTTKTRVRAGESVITGWPGIALSDSNGAFAISVLPGPGHLLVHGPTHDFAFQEIGDRELGDGRPGGRRNYAHAILPVDPPSESTLPLEFTIKLKRVPTFQGRLLTAEGHPVDEALMISRLQIDPTSPMWRGTTTEIVRGGQFALSGLSPGVPCPVYFLDPAHQTGVTTQIEANSASQEPLTLKLAPCGAAKARFVDSEGKSIAELEPSLSLVVTPGVAQFDRSPAARGKLVADQDFAVNIDRKNQSPLPKTGADGVATFRVLIPGAVYQLHGARNRELAVLKQFTAEPGKTLDLGDIVSDRPRGR